MTTNVSGASIKVASGPEIKADGTATGTASGAAFTTAKLPNGTYTVTVSKDGYKEVSKEVVVNGGDVEVNIDLEKYSAPTEIKATAVGARKIQITSDAPVESSAKVTVKKGVVNIDVDKFTISDDKKSIDVETAGKLVKGDYTITVTGTADKDLTTILKAEDEKVAKIDITTKTAPYAADDEDQKVLTADYKILNQYNEDVTSANVGEITWNSASGLKVASIPGKVGKIKITSTTALVPNSKIYVTAVHAKTGTVANAELTVGIKAKADEVTFKGIYNVKTNKFENLPANFDNNTYVLLYEVKDQYGNNLDADEDIAGDLLFTSNNPLFVDVDGSVVKDVNDTTYMAVKLKNAVLSENGGKATIQVISKYTGKTGKFEINADAASQVKTFKLSAPDKIVAEGEDCEIPFTALDQNGKSITKYKDLVDKVTLSGCVFKEKADGTAKIVFKAPSTGASDDTDAPSSLTSLVKNGGDFSSLIINVKETARPTAIKGLKDVETKVSVDSTATIELKNILVQDQYGRVMGNDKVETWLKAPSNNKIIVETEKPADGKSAFTVVKGEDADSEKFTIATDDIAKKITLTPSKDAGNKDSEKIKISLSTSVDKDSNAIPVDGSEKEILFTRVGQSEFSSYAVDDLGIMYNNAQTQTEIGSDTKTDDKYDKTVKVYGVRDDGTKVLLDNTSKTYYEVSAASDVKLDFKTNGTIKDADAKSGYVKSDFQDKDGNIITKTVKINVAIYDVTTKAEITTITKDLVLSTETPKPTTVNFTDKVKDDQFEIAPDEKAINAAKIKAAVKEVKDQYGQDDATEPTITISKIVKSSDSSNIAVVNNGKSDANLTGVETGDKFTVTLHYGDKAVSFTVIAVAAA